MRSRVEERSVDFRDYGDFRFGVLADAAERGPPIPILLGQVADPRDLGHKTLAVNLSDLAAMGAEPAWATLALTLPKPDATAMSRFRRQAVALGIRYVTEKPHIGRRCGSDGAHIRTVAGDDVRWPQPAVRREDLEPGQSQADGGEIEVAGSSG